jgi:hypothetical protein
MRRKHGNFRVGDPAWGRPRCYAPGNHRGICVTASAILSHSAENDGETAEVVVSVRYLNNLTGPPPAEETPFPFDADTTNLIIGGGGVTSTHDTRVTLSSSNCCR